jgi:CheY-like chemotaxis protein
LLTFSRKQVVRPTTLNTTALVANAAQMLRRLIGEDIRLVIVPPVPTGLDNVVADRGQLEQVLLNLAVNARDAMPRGGILTISVQNVELDAAFVTAYPAVKAGPYVQLTVTDTGSGMSPEICSHLFEPFFTTKGHSKGTGLGLATVHGIVAEHHGCVTVDSAPDHGATFSVYLPLAAAAVQDPVADGSTVARGTETILLAEDERALRDLTAKMLRTAGYTVIPAENGPLALAALTSPGVHVDLLLTDVIMPGMSGPELAAEVLRRHPAIRVLFTSGYTDDKLTLGAGIHVDQFIPKPYGLGDLTRAIRSLLDTTGAKPA